MFFAILPRSIKPSLVPMTVGIRESGKYTKTGLADRFLSYSRLWKNWCISMEIKRLRGLFAALLGLIVTNHKKCIFYIYGLGEVITALTESVTGTDSGPI